MTATIQLTASDQLATAPAPFAVDALYLHVPFCSHKCHYCDFYSIVDRTGRQTAFVDALMHELDRWTSDASHAETTPLRPRTVFFGGGTPSLLRPALWRTLLDFMQCRGVLEHVEEFTVEANPDTVTEELVDVLAAAGVNRVSLGVQSFDRSMLKALQREHEPAHVPRAVNILRNGGVDNVNVDLIFAVPGQTIPMLDADLDAALELNPHHVSCYNLTYEPGTPMTSRMHAGQLSPAPESLERAMLQRVIDRMDLAGFVHYEISNWGKREQESRRAEEQGIEQKSRKSENKKIAMASDDKTAPSSISCSSALPLSCSDHTPLSCSLCLHNLMYWTNANWLGLGPSAASHVNGRRWKNEGNLGRYLADSPRPAVVESERLDPDRQLGEHLMLGLRLRQGVDRAWLSARMRADDERWDTIDSLVGMGMLQRSSGRLRLTAEGLFVADAVIAKLL